MSIFDRLSFLSFVVRFVLFLSSIVAAGSLPVYAVQSDQVDAQLRDGLFLILDTCTREQELHFLPIVKTTPSKISDYLKRISTAADETIATVHRLQKGDASLNLSSNPLPAIEQKAQKLFIGAARQKVLFGTKGPDYIRALLVDQIQESVYIGSLAQVTGVEDTDLDGAKTLGQIASKWFKLRDEGYRLLNQVN